MLQYDNKENFVFVIHTADTTLNLIGYQELLTGSLTKENKKVGRETMYGVCLQ